MEFFEWSPLIPSFTLGEIFARPPPQNLKGKIIPPAKKHYSPLYINYEPSLSEEL